MQFFRTNAKVMDSECKKICLCVSQEKHLRVQCILNSFLSQVAEYWLYISTVFGGKSDFCLPSLHHFRLAFVHTIQVSGPFDHVLSAYIQSCFGAIALSAFLLDKHGTNLFLICLRAYEVYQDFTRTGEKIHYNSFWDMWIQSPKKNPKNQTHFQCISGMLCHLTSPVRDQCQ